MTFGWSVASTWSHANKDSIMTTMNLFKIEPPSSEVSSTGNVPQVIEIQKAFSRNATRLDFKNRIFASAANDRTIE